MGILDRFISKKEREVKASVGAKAPTKASPPAKKSVAKPVPAAKAEAPKAVAKGPVPAHLLRVLVKPLVTEQAAILASHGQYVFRVALSANRVEVKNAMKAVYGIVPASVNIQRVRGKAVRYGKTYGRRQTWKKAIVTLPKGAAIDVYAGV